MSRQSCNSLQHSGHGAPLTLVTRRGALKVSLGTALGAALGPTLPSAFAGSGASGSPAPKSVILLWLEGGPCQQDSFDPKESKDKNLEYRFPPIATSSPDLRLASCMPRLAHQGNELTVVRTMFSPEIDHAPAQYYMQTGWRNTGPLQAPAIGSIVSHELGVEWGAGLPAFVSIGGAGYSSGCFGAAHRPMIVWDPNKPPENLGLPRDVPFDVFRRRLQLLTSLEEGRSGKLARSYHAGREMARRFMGSNHRVAFDISREPVRSRDAYGTTEFGKGCLLARRLVEAGVRFVQVRHPGYDTHKDHYPKHEGLLREVDQGMAQLIIDLKDRGLLENTVVIATGEFGRTPTINGNKGRDHWLKGWSIAMAGGGFQGGFAYGRTSERSEIVDNPVSVPDFMATLFEGIGIDPLKEYHDDFDRPSTLVDGGNVIEDLFA